MNPTSIQSAPGAASLPARPSLDRLRRSAKELLRQQKTGIPEALARIAAVHPKHLAQSPESLAAAPFRLADAQLVVARECGFPSWPKLKAYVESITGDRADRLRLSNPDITYYRERAAGLLSAHASKLPLAGEQIVRSHPAFRTSTPEEALAGAFSIYDALMVTAREHGFSSWAQFEVYVKALHRGATIEPFLAACEAIKANNIDLLREWLARDGSLLNARGTNGNTLLNLAAGVQKIKPLRLLIGMGADINIPNVRGWSPLHEAASDNRTDMMQLLLDAGARMDGSALGDGGTPLVVSLFWGHREAPVMLAERMITPINLRAAAGLGRLDIIQELVPKRGVLVPTAGAHRGFYRPHSGFPVWHPSDSPQEILDEALTYAARSSRIDAMALLIERGADIHGDPYRGKPLHWAVRTGRHFEAVNWLLDHGADADERSSFGGPGFGEDVTALHVAAIGGHLEMARLLLERGADPNLAESLYGNKASGWAEYGGHADVAEYLKGLER